MFGVPLEQDLGHETVSEVLLPVRRRRGPLRRGAACRGRKLGNTNRRRLGRDFGLLMAFGVLFPNQTVLMGFLFPIKAKYMVMIYGAIELLLAFSVNDGVSNIAHLGGMVFGYVYLKGRLPRLSLPDWNGAYKQWKLQRAKKKFQVYMRKHGDRGPWVN